MSKVLFGVLALGTLVSIAAHANAEPDSANASRTPGSCGQYMYWQRQMYGREGQAAHEILGRRAASEFWQMARLAVVVWIAETTVRLHP
jgi:hypothetical protein